VASRGREQQQQQQQMQGVAAQQHSQQQQQLSATDLRTPAELQWQWASPPVTHLQWVQLQQGSLASGC
jgi:hypothetical protein